MNTSEWKVKKSSYENFSKAAYTVVTPNYLARALSLKRSFLEHNPEAEFFIGILGNKNHCPEINVDNGYFFNALSDSRIEGMIGRYQPFEMNCVLKPFFASYILEQHSNQSLYLMECSENCNNSSIK